MEVSGEKRSAQVNRVDKLTLQQMRIGVVLFIERTDTCAVLVDLDGPTRFTQHHTEQAFPRVFLGTQSSQVPCIKTKDNDIAMPAEIRHDILRCYVLPPTTGVPDMTNPILTSTPQGDRLNEAGVIDAAVASGLLDSSGLALGTAAQSAPHSTALQFAHRLFDGIAFTEEQEKQAAGLEHPITSELDLVQRVQHLIDKGAQAGYHFTVTIDASGKPVPAATKI